MPPTHEVFNQPPALTEIAMAVTLVVAAMGPPA